jgi:hypothetical protein
MRIISTSDVPLENLREFAGDLSPEFDVHVDASQVFLRTAEPPSWVALLAEANWWVKLLAGYAALYVAELVKEAAKDTWRHRGKAVAVAAVAGGQLRRLASSIAALRRRLAPRTTVGIGLPVPNEFFSTRLALDGEDPDALVAQLALFIHHIPALAELITRHELAEGRAATGVFLALRDDGSLLVSWHDRDTLEMREHILSLRDAV